MKMKKILSLALGLALACSMVPNAMADDITPEDLIAAGTVIVTPESTMTKVAGTTFDEALTLGGVEGNKYWHKGDYWGIDSIEFVNATSYNSNPLDAKMTFDIDAPAGINKGDICLAKIDVFTYNPAPEHTQPLQFALTENDYTDVSSPIVVDTDEHEDGKYAATVYLPIKATTSYSTDAKFEIGVGGWWNAGYMGNITLVNLASDYSMSEVRTALGMTPTFAEVASVGSTIVENADLLEILKANDSYVNKTIDSDENGTADLTYFHQNDGTHIDGVRMQTGDNYIDNSALKIQIPLTEAVNSGDVLVIKYKVDSFKGWDSIGFAQFGITDGSETTKSNLTKFGKTGGWQTTWEYAELYSAIVADKNYAAGSYFEIYAGFSDWMDALIGDLTVKNIGSDYNANQVLELLGIGVPGIKYISPKKEDSGNISVRFSAEGAVQDEAVKYVAAAYNASGKLLDAKIVEDAQGTVATVMNTVPTPIDNRNIPVFDSSVAYDDIATIKVMAFTNTDTEEVASLTMVPMFESKSFTK